MGHIFDEFDLHEINIDDMIDDGINSDDECPYTDAFDFLMGSCNIFALALKREFGYCIYDMYNVENAEQLIHSFCIVKQNDKTFFIDVRGVYANFDAFICRFHIEDFNIKNIRPHNSKDDINLKNEWDHIGIQFAEAIIKKYHEHYAI